MDSVAQQWDGHAHDRINAALKEDGDDVCDVRTGPGSS
jgi:hypothetical protein